MVTHQLTWYNKLWAAFVSTCGYSAQNFFLYLSALTTAFTFLNALLSHTDLDPREKQILNSILYAWSFELFFSNVRSFYLSYLEISKHSNNNKAYDIEFEGTTFDECFYNLIKKISEKKHMWSSQKIGVIITQLNKQKNELERRTNEELALTKNNPAEILNIMNRVLSAQAQEMQNPTAKAVESFSEKLFTFFSRHCDVMGTEAKVIATDLSLIKFVDDNLKLNHTPKYMIDSAISIITLVPSMLAQFSNLAKGRPAEMRTYANIHTAEAITGFIITYAIGASYGCKAPFLKAFAALYGISFIEAIPLAIPSIEKTGLAWAAQKVYRAYTYLCGSKPLNNENTNESMPLINPSKSFLFSYGSLWLPRSKTPTPTTCTSVTNTNELIINIT